MSDDHIVRSFLRSFWMHFGGLVGGFLDHFGVMLRSQIVLESPWEVCWAWKSIFQVRLRPFWRVLERFWGSFWRYFDIFCRYRLHYEILYDLKTIFDGFWYLVNKQNWGKSMEGSAKINFASYLLWNEYGHRSWTDFGSGWQQFWFPIGLQKRLRMQVL